MGLSLSVLLALIFLLPGAAFVLGFSRLHSPTSPPTLLDQHFSLGLVIALLATIVFHGLWFGALSWLLSLLEAPTPSALKFGILLSGAIASDEGRGAFESLQNYPIRATGYFLGITLLAWRVGRAMNKRFHRKPSASWFDLLRPSDADFVWLTAETHMDGSCFLFAGVVREFSVDKTGNLERVVLGFAVKRPLSPTGGVDAAALSGAWVEIPGEFVVLQMKDSNTVNVDYFYDEDEADNVEPSVEAENRNEGVLVTAEA